MLKITNMIIYIYDSARKKFLILIYGRPKVIHFGDRRYGCPELHLKHYVPIYYLQMDEKSTSSPRVLKF